MAGNIDPRQVIRRDLKGMVLAGERNYSFDASFSSNMTPDEIRERLHFAINEVADKIAKDLAPKPPERITLEDRLERLENLMRRFEEVLERNGTEKAIVWPNSSPNRD